MSEKLFTKTEVEKALKLMLAGTSGLVDPDELKEMIHDLPDELKIIVAKILTMSLIDMMASRVAEPAVPRNPFDEVFEALKGRSKSCPCHNKEDDEEDEDNITVLKNGKPATKEERDELFRKLGKMFGK